MILLLLLLAAFCAAVLFAFKFYFGSGRKRPYAERVMLAATPTLVVLMTMQLSLSIIRMPDRDWNAARITPSVAWTKGHDVYHPKDEGPILNTLYGPGTVLTFSPAALASTPTGAVLIAGTINVAAMSLPLLFLVMRIRIRETNDTDHCLRWLVWVLSCGAVYLSHGPEYAIKSIHADAPAMGMMVLACAVIMLSADSLSVRRLALSAFLAAFSCFTKQIEVFALPGLFFFIGLAFSWRRAFVYAALVTGWAVILAAAFGATMGGIGDMMFNIVEVPSQHGWKGPRVSILIKSGVTLGMAGIFLLLMLLPFAGKAFSRKRTGLASTGEVLREHRWTLFVFVAFTMLPGSLMGEVKVGGLDNSYHTLYYLMVALGLAALGWVADFPDERRRIALAGVYLVAAIMVGLRGPDLINLLHLRSVGDNAQQQAYEFAKKHPGEAIFPWNPLSTLYADGQVYHFEYGVYDRVFAGFQPSQEHFRKHLPKNLKYIIWRHHRECFQIPQFLPEFSKRINVADLDGPLDKPIKPPPFDPMEPPELNETANGGWMVLTRE
jgi:hypothetical protein